MEPQHQKRPNGGRGGGSGGGANNQPQRSASTAPALSLSTISPLGTHQEQHKHNNSPHHHQHHRSSGTSLHIPQLNHHHHGVVPPGAVLVPPNSRHNAVLDTHTHSRRVVARELLSPTRMRSRRSIIDVRLPSTTEDDNEEEEEDAQTSKAAIGDDESSFLLDNSSHSQYGASTLLDNSESDGINGRQHHHPKYSSSRKGSAATSSFWEELLQQSTAVLVICLLNMMIAIPFGSSYFPIGWSEAGGPEGYNGQENEEGDDEEDVHGDFPIAGKQALGIRMFLFATLIGQFAFTFASKFTNPVGLQMVENVPFLHALAFTVIDNQGYGIDALSTLFFLFGLSSVIVGLTFYLLGKWQLGRIVYFFPNHVLVGCIGGIGVFIVITSIEVTTNSTFTFDLDGLKAIAENFNLLWVVLAFEITLRVLMIVTQDSHGHPKFPWLSPVYYCLITPLFYLGLIVAGISMDEATDIGYFFPATVTPNDGAGVGSSWWQDDGLWKIFQIIDFANISWKAVFQSTGTMVALAAFSLIHVPINIPAFAISTDVGMYKWSGLQNPLDTLTH